MTVHDITDEHVTKIQHKKGRWEAPNGKRYDFIFSREAVEAMMVQSDECSIKNNVHSAIHEFVWKQFRVEFPLFRRCFDSLKIEIQGFLERNDEYGKFLHAQSYRPRNKNGEFTTVWRRPINVAVLRHQFSNTER